MRTRLFVHFCMTMLFLAVAITLLINDYLLLTSLFTTLFGLSGGVFFVYLSNWNFYENKVQDQSSYNFRQRS